MQNAGTEVLSGRDKRILYDKLANFKGTARIAIKHLTFPYPSRQIDRKIIEQLLRDFKGEGCRPEEPDHRIPAIVDDSVLEAALQVQGFEGGDVTFGATYDADQGMTYKSTPTLPSQLLERYKAEID
ncbi:hypothetical protein HYALB_00013360 [Hymenoscyphus albidus]|uniref:Uncharacterized protein n=1 Tax=Hymenoscyphus albidus TaxID=595503 RepID=A0A9N9LXW6_9HELO|nr:hypothetical protein HYALB_00013360 [Hymenoscyphus albidus]